MIVQMMINGASNVEVSVEIHKGNKHKNEPWMGIVSECLYNICLLMLTQDL